MNIYESAEDYLEQILMLLEKKGHARSIDIATGLNVSKPSVSVAMKAAGERVYPHEHGQPDLPDRQGIRDRAEDLRPAPGADEIPDPDRRSRGDRPGGCLQDRA